MKRAQVFRLSMAHPGDLSELERLITSEQVRAGDVTAIIGKTEGNGGVNDFTRGYFTQTLMGLLSRHLGRPSEQLIREIPCVLSGGTEGVMSPHYHVFCISDAEPAAKRYPSALAIGTAFSAPVAAEDVGRRAHVESVAGAVRQAIASAGIERLDDVHFVQVKCPCVTVARAAAAIAAEAGVSVGEFYERFPSKDNFLGRLIDRQLRGATESAERELDHSTWGHRNPEDIVRAIVEHIVSTMHGAGAGIIRTTLKRGASRPAYLEPVAEYP